jgi:hypothetical protein
MEIADLIGKIRTRRSNLILDDLAEVCGNIAVLISSWERNMDFKMSSYEEALATDLIVGRWILFAQNAALGGHTYILEDGPELPKSSGPHADEGGEVLEGMNARRSRNTGFEDNQEWQVARFQHRGYGPGMPKLRRNPRMNRNLDNI